MEGMGYKDWGKLKQHKNPVSANQGILVLRLRIFARKRICEIALYVYLVAVSNKKQAIPLVTLSTVTKGPNTIP